MGSLRGRVTPGARGEGLAGWREGVLRVWAAAAPEKGKANEAICRLIARHAGSNRSP
jgi:uncharacterized protein YggU (UPF0235/DUF167 family)